MAQRRPGPLFWPRLPFMSLWGIRAGSLLHFPTQLCLTRPQFPLQERDTRCSGCSALISSSCGLNPFLFTRGFPFLNFSCLLSLPFNPAFLLTLVFPSILASPQGLFSSNRLLVSFLTRSGSARFILVPSFVSFPYIELTSRPTLICLGSARPATRMPFYPKPLDRARHHADRHCRRTSLRKR